MLTDTNNKRNKVLKNCVLAIGLAFAGAATAHDLGVQGKLWPITEVDMRQLIMESVARADFSKANAELAESSKNYVNNLPKRTMGRIEVTDTRWIDPSIEIASDIQGVSEDPADQKIKWSTMYKRGTRVNPLAVFRPTKALFFFDGTSSEQLEFAREILREDRYGRVTLIEASGANVAKLSEALGRPIFYASDFQLQRFNITLAPSLLYPGDGEHDGLLGLTTFAAPFNVSALKAAWELDVTKSRGPLTGSSNAIVR